MCQFINPCFCCPGPAEVGVYIMSILHSLYITTTFVLGIAIGYDTMLIVFCPEGFQFPIPLHHRIFQAMVFIWYTLTFIVEVILREYLYKTIEMATQTKIHRCYTWIRARVLQMAIGVPFATLYVHLHKTWITIVLYCCGWLYHLYYTWVVYHYVKLLEKPKNVQQVIQTNQFTIAIDPGVPLSTLNTC